MLVNLCLSTFEELLARRVVRPLGRFPWRVHPVSTNQSAINNYLSSLTFFVPFLPS